MSLYNIMTAIMKLIADALAENGMSTAELVTASGMESRTVKLLLAGSYIPSPSERARIAAALGMAVDEIEWGHTVPVQHLRGNGPQSGRST
jgi:lambda repressor-like predicted transcriptional regulator